MRVLAILEADFEHTPIGTRSRLEQAIGAGAADEKDPGTSVLTRTIRRLQQCKRLAGICLAVRSSQKQRAEQAVAGLNVGVKSHDAPPAPWRAPAATGGRCASARKWSLDAWRGGIGGFCAMDEGANTWVLEAVGRHAGCDAVMPVPAAAVLIDPALTDAMVDHFEEIHKDLRLAFTPAPPGLVAPVFGIDLLADLCKAAWPLGRTFAYRPDDPQRDLLIRSCCYRAGPEIEHPAGRLLADTDRGVARLEALLGQTTPPPDARQIGRWLSERDRWNAGTLPREIEIELTTDDHLAHTTLRPRGERAGQRGPIDIALLDRVFAELATMDDSLVVFGGFGEPLLHPQFGEIIRRARQAGVFGIAIRTNALDLDAPRAEAIMQANVDVVSVLLDAHSPGIYRELHKLDGYERAVANVNAFLKTLQERQQPCPFVVPEMIKTRQTIGQMEAFYDDWIRKAGAAVIAGPPAYGGPFGHLAVMNMAPPRRVPCSRLWSRLVVLADGRVTACDQDARGEHAVGRLQDSPLSEIWTGRTLCDLRHGHREGDYGGMPLCPACREWHRP